MVKSSEIAGVPPGSLKITLKTLQINILWRFSFLKGDSFGDSFSYA